MNIFSEKNQFLKIRKNQNIPENLGFVFLSLSISPHLNLLHWEREPLNILFISVCPR